MEIPSTSISLPEADRRPRHSAGTICSTPRNFRRTANSQQCCRIDKTVEIRRGRTVGVLMDRQKYTFQAHRFPAPDLAARSAWGRKRFRRMGPLALLVLALCWLAPAAVSAQAQTTHVVQPGETLSEIAKQYGTSTTTLVQLNNLASADVVWAGMEVQLPDLSESDASTPSTGSGQAGSAQESDASTEEAEIVPGAAAQPETMEAPVRLADLAVPIPQRFVDADGAFRYFVEPGDTLSSIADEFRVGVSILVDLNRLSPAQRLTPGESLLIPYSPFGGGRDRTHVVQPGESLGALATRYGTTLDALVARNNIANPSIIAPGVELLVPPPPPVERMSVFPVDADGIQRPLVFPTSDEKWINVDLSEQRVIAYEGSEPVNIFIISSGKAGSPTVTGTFRIWIKTAIQDMWGGDRAAGDYYYLPGVKWVQYFHEDYSFHTAYWHNSFGTPMSRGCINMREADARWLFEWAGPAWDDAGEGWQRPAEDNPGTLVVIHQ